MSQNGTATAEALGSDYTAESFRKLRVHVIDDVASLAVGSEYIPDVATPSHEQVLCSS